MLAMPVSSARRSAAFYGRLRCNQDAGAGLHGRQGIAGASAASTDIRIAVTEASARGRLGLAARRREWTVTDFATAAMMKPSNGGSRLCLQVANRARALSAAGSCADSGPK